VDRVIGWLAMGRVQLLLVALVCALGVALALGGPGSTPVSSAAGSTASCREVAYPVRVLGGQHTLRATLCRPLGGPRPRAALVLVHGSTYSRVYWDFPVKSARYSATRILARAGYLTLTIDRLGSGESDRPPSDQVTADVSADALHQVISQLRSDAGTRTRSGKVFVVGHSSGATLSIREAAQFDDVDGIVVTAFMHSSGPGSELFEPMIHPAAEDPKFDNDPSIPAGYSTTRPGVRLLWYYPFNADERVVEADEQTKDAMPGADSGGFVEELLDGTFARQLHVPVLDLVGSHDLNFCTPPDCKEAASEASFYPASPEFQIIVRPRTAHNLNLHLNAAKTTALIRRWADRHSARPR
jgi:pimeloyl-ACP methyl ester carboxylesterase